MSEAKHSKKNLLVIGAGPGGYPAAFRAAQLGFNVTLVDPRQPPGGVCLYEGCIPSKALLRLSRLLLHSRESAEWGIHFPEPRIDIDQMRDRVKKAVTQLTGGLGQLSQAKGVKPLQGTARFRNEKSVTVTDASGKKTTVEFAKAIIATGSESASLPFASDDRSAIWTSRDALGLPSIPRKLLVVGAGYIGLEMGTIYSALGSEVTVVETEDTILPGVDPDLTQFLQKRLEKKGPGSFQELILNGKLVDMEPTGKGMAARLRNGKGVETTREFQKVLVAVGRKPVTQDLDLDEAGIETNDQGFIQTDAACQTTNSSVYAVGDVAGEPMLAHKASHEGTVAAEHAAGLTSAFDSDAIPAVVFTDPEIAWTGLTEAEARRWNIDVEVARFPWTASGRAVASGRPQGLTKLIFEKRSERLLGAGIAGVEAGELIAEACLAISMGALAPDIARTIHPHPTLSETIMEGASLYLGHSAHFQPGKP